MKPIIAACVVATYMVGAFTTGCETPQEHKSAPAGDATQDLKDARAAYLAELETFKRESAQVIAANEKRIKAFKAKMEEAGPSMKARYTKDVAALEQKNRDLKKALEDYTDRGQTTWEEFKTNFSRDMDALGKTMTDLFKDTQ